MIFWITFQKVNYFFGKSRSEEFLFFKKNWTRKYHKKALEERLFFIPPTNGKSVFFIEKN